MADNAIQKKPGFIARVKRFFKDSKGEFKKIVWPAKSQIINNATIVVGVVIVASVFVGGLDILTSYLIKFFLSLL